MTADEPDPSHAIETIYAPITREHLERTWALLGRPPRVLTRRQRLRCEVRRRVRSVRTRIAIWVVGYDWRDYDY